MTVITDTLSCLVTTNNANLSESITQQPSRHSLGITQVNVNRGLPIVLTKYMLKMILKIIVEIIKQCNLSIVTPDPVRL